LAQHQQVSTDLLEEILNKMFTLWLFFSKEEFLTFINKCNNASTPRPDKLSWRHFKTIIHNLLCFENFINIANTCINLGHWLLHFKMSTSIIIPKPNKISYDIPKTFRLIVLLNTLSKLIKKVIGERLQFQSLSKNMIHPC